MLLGIACLYIFIYQPSKHQAFAQVSGFCICTTNNVTVITLGFVLIVFLIIFLWLLWLDGWLYCFDCIVLALLLIILLLIILFWLYCWLYCFWLYCFNCSDHIASYICAWKCFLFLVLFDQLFLLQGLSSPRYNSLYSCITYLYPTIH